MAAQGNDEHTENKNAEELQQEERAGSAREEVESGDEEGIKVSMETILELHKIALELPVACDFCPEKFRNMEKFDDHMAHHVECRFFSCQLCNNTYVSWGNLVAHRKACHRSEVISCESCSQRKHHTNLGPVNFPVGKFPIGCEECHEGFSTVIQLYRHYRVRGKHAHKKKVDHLPEEELSRMETFGCPVCNTQFFTEEQLKTHLVKLEDDETCFPCSVCNMRFCNAHVLVVHKRSHPDQVLKSYLCSYCGKVLRDRGTYQRHKMIHTGEKPFKCDRCPKSFTRKSALESHLYGHPVKADYNCFNCGLCFKECADLKKHVDEEHLSDKRTKLTCGVCREDFRVDLFINHYQMCHVTKEEECAMQRRNTVTCHVCKKVFSQPAALSRHMKLHNPSLKELFKCEICDEVIVRRFEVLAHLRTHYGDDDANLPEKYQKMLKSFQPVRKTRETGPQMSFICEYCGREFRKKINLQLHVRRHTGERPHSCQLCGKAFYTRQQMAIHARQHTGERSYECKVCQKTFTGTTALYMHRKVHNKSKKQYTCTHCGREFFWRSAYIGHLRQHTGERPYKCTLCPKSFTLKGKLNLHMKKHEQDHIIHTCGDCGEHFGSKEELSAHQVEQCCSTKITFTEGEEYIILADEEVIDDQVYILDNKLTGLVVKSLN